MPRAVAAFLLFLGVLTLRVWGVSEHFWLLRDQTRDWAIVLSDFRDLPLVGPATHVDGYTIGPAFYWILWGLRHLFGPWFDDLPHAGGIGQAVLQTAVDAGLLLAIWKRTQSAWIALATAILVMTSSYDLSLAQLVWNPTMGSTLAKLAMALVLSDWYRVSWWRAMVTVAVAWMAVHAYTGAIFVTASVCAIVVFEPLLPRDPRTTLQAARPADSGWRIAGVSPWCVMSRAGATLTAIGLLQLPYLRYQLQNGFGDRAMGAVTDSVGTILSGGAAPRFAASFHGYFAALDLLQLRPGVTSGSLWWLALAAPLVAVRYRRDPVFVVLCLLPQGLAIVGFAFFLGALDHYYYLSLTTPAVLTVVAAVVSLLPAPAPTSSSTQLAPRRFGAHAAGGLLLCLGVMALVPDRFRHAQMGNRMPEYGTIVRASRVLAHRGQPLYAIETGFPLPPTADPDIVFRILGGQFDAHSPWTAIIARDGTITYRRQGS